MPEIPIERIRISRVKRTREIRCELVLPRELPSTVLEALMREFNTRVRAFTMRDQAIAARRGGAQVEPVCLDQTKAAAHTKSIRDGIRGVDKSVPTGNGSRA